MKKILLTIALSFLLAATVVSAAIPEFISLQGRLSDTNSNPLNGNYDFDLEIYDAASGGTLIWSEMQNDIPVTNGIFNILLGNAQTLDDDFEDEYWVEISVESSALSPRVRLTSSPYAYYAENVNTTVIEESTEDLYVDETGDTMSGGLNMNNNGIGNVSAIQVTWIEDHTDNTLVINDSAVVFGDLSVAENIWIGNIKTELSKGAGDSVKIKTYSGSGELGPQNSNFFHFTTDRPAFWFNTTVTTKGNITPYTTNVFNLGTDSFRWANVYTNQMCLAGTCKTSWPSSIVDTNANTICSGTNKYLDGDGNCDTVIDTDTNANTLCSGTNKYLDGDGNCDTIATTSDHGGLTGLADDDHTQYLERDGSDSMSGNLNMADKHINDANTVQANTLEDPEDSQLNVADNLYISGDISFEDEIKPDDVTCSNGQILKKTGTDNWDCVDGWKDSWKDYFKEGFRDINCGHGKLAFDSYGTTLSTSSTVNYTGTQICSAHGAGSCVQVLQYNYGTYKADLRAYTSMGRLGCSVKKSADQWVVDATSADYLACCLLP